MSIKLMPSQKQLYENIVAKEEKYFRRNNIILFGKQQTGKTELVKYISQKEKNYKYINFTKKHLESFVSNTRLNSIRFNDLQDYLRINFSNGANKNTKVILDEIDSIITVIARKDSYKLSNLYKQFLHMDLPTEFIFVSSIFNDFILSDLISNFKDRIYVLGFKEADKKHIIKHFYSNINLFDIEDIVNLRQLLSR